MRIKGGNKRRAGLMLALSLAVAMACGNAATAATVTTWNSDQTISSTLIIDTDRTYIQGGATVTIASGGNVTSSPELDIGYSTNGNLTIEGTGIVTAGTTTYLGRGATGVLTMTGGEFSMASGTFYLSRGATASGTLEISGGEFEMLGSFRPYGDGTAIFKVIGSDATITINSFTMTPSTGTSTLAFIIDDSGSVSKINAQSVALGATVVDMGLLGFTPVKDQTFDLITANGDGNTINIDSLSLAAGDEAAWKLQLSADSKTLQAVAVPEPATMGLLGMGLVGLLARRRRR